MKTKFTSLKKAIFATIALVICLLQVGNAATLNLKLYLQGYYLQGGTMSVSLFNSGLSMDQMDVDTITIKLLDPTSFAIVESVKGILKSDGSCSVPIATPIGSSYFIDICHRSSLQTMSSTQVILSNITTYDFSTSASNAYGDNQVEVESGIYALYTGDLDHNCIINGADANIVSADAANSLFGYLCSDINGDGFVDASDFILIDQYSQTSISCNYPGAIPPCPGCTNSNSVLSWPTTYDVLCSGDGPIQLSGATPTGGTYSGFGVDANGVFHPIHPAGIGLQILTYTYFNPATQQNETINNSILVIDCPCIGTLCRDFNDNNLHGWDASAASPNVTLSLSNTGSQLGASDYYASALDIDGPSKFETGTDFIGRWCCGEFCYDIKLFDDADPTAVLSAQPIFYIMRGSKGFKYTANTYVHETDGWQRICAPITNCNPMPISATGVWEPIAGTNANDWDFLTNHIDAILFEADQFGNAGEVRGFDNVCFNSTGISVTLTRTSCDIISASVTGCCGPYTYSWSGGTLVNESTITNLIGGTTYILTVENSLGEIATTSITVDQITVDAGPDQTFCTIGSLINLHGTTNIIGAPKIWTPLGPGSISGGQGTADAIVIGEGCYQLSVTDPITGCTATDIVCVGITACPAEALDFDGIDDYVNLGSNSLIRPTNALTVEVWLYQANWAAVLNKTIIGNTEAGGYSIEFDLGNLLSSWLFRGGSYGIAQYNCSGLTSGWHHLAMTFDGRYNKLFVDGNMVASNDAGATYPIAYSTSLTLIGAETTGGSQPDPNSYCEGKFDEVRIWNYARDCGEISLTKNCELSGTESGLLAYYKFNQGLDAQPNPSVMQTFDSKTNSLLGDLQNFSLTGPTSNWIAPGAVTVGSSCTGTIYQAEIEIRGNNLIITDGDAIPDFTDHTEFGLTNLTNTIVRTFTIKNNGNAPLVISGLTVTGSDFTVSSLTPSSPILPGNSATFYVTFSPTTIGLKTATIHINSNDCDESDYDFAIQGSREDCFTCNSLNATPSVTINTGYNENTNSALGIGANELNWSITQQPSWSALTLPAIASTIYYNPFSNPNFFPFPTSQWISVNPSGYAGSNLYSDLPFTFDYEFCLCEDDSVTFDLHSLVDDSLVVYVNNYSNTLYYQSFTLTGQQAGQQNYLYTIFLPKGTHRLKADLRNYGGPLGFDISGTISGNHLLKHGSCKNSFLFVDAGSDIRVCNTGASIPLHGTTNITGAPMIWSSTNGGIISSGQGTADPSVSGNACYILTVIDPVTGCVYTDTVCVELISVLVTATVEDVLCNGQSTGRIWGQVIGGDPGYTAVINPDPNNVNPILNENFSFDNLPQGIYEITGVDGNGCTYTEPFTISEPLPLSVTVTPPSELCIGEQGSLNISAFGGTGNYNYIIQPGSLIGNMSNGSSISTFATLGAGNYSFTLTDANGCTATNNFTITEIICCDSLNPLGKELIVNGDFRNPTAATGSSLPLSCTCLVNSYCIGPNARSKCGGFLNVLDHSNTVSGTIPPFNYLIVDGNDAAPAIIWKQNIGAVYANKTYVFSYWIQPRVSNSPPSPDISLRVRNANNITSTFTLHSVNGTNIPNQWTQYLGTWTPTSDIASAELYLFQSTWGYGGFDYGIDDISFRGCQADCPDSILTASLVMSTGYDHIANSTYGTNVSDGGWSVVHTTPDVTVPKPYSAWTIDKHPSWPNALGNGQWISAYNHYRDEYNNLAPDSAYEFEYCFCLCKADTVKFDFNALADDYAEFYLKENPGTIFGSVSSWSTSNHIQYQKFLPAGQHCIRAAVRNLHSVAMGLSISGTIQSDFLMKWGECDGIKPIVPGPIDLNVQNQPQVGTPTVNNVSCAGTNNGNITVPVYGGTPPYTYAWSNGVTTPTNVGLSPGNYSLTVTDSLGGTSSGSYVITEPTPIIVTASLYNECLNNSDGNIQLNVAGGISPYSYSWNNGSATSNPNNLIAGNYTVSVVDNNGCTNSQTYMLSNVDCITHCCEPGSTNIVIFDVQFDTMTVAPPIGSSDLAYNCTCQSGTYCVSTDANLKCANFNSVLASPNGIGKYMIVEGHSTVPNKRVWKETVNVQAGTKYVFNSYTFNKLDANSIRPVLSIRFNGYIVGGNDTVSATDRVWVEHTFCWTADTTGDIIVDIIQNNTGGEYGIDNISLQRCVPLAPPVVSVDLGGDHVVCPGSVSGWINATVNMNYIPIPPPFVRWNDGFIGPVRVGLTPGRWWVVVTDGIINYAADTIDVIESLPIVVSSTITIPTCYGQSNGTIFTSINGGSSPFSYSWNNGAVSPNLTNISSGSYSVYITDINSCTGSATFTVAQPSKVEGSTTTISPGCSGIDGIASVIAIGGTGSYSYLWSASAGSQTTATATGLSPGNYSVIITDANGCTGSANATVGNSTVVLPSAPGPIAGPTSACRNTIGIVFSVSPVLNATSYQWTLPLGASGTSSTNSITVSFSSTYNGGFISVAALNICGTGPQVFKNIPVITTYPTQPSVIVGPAIACGPQTLTYSTTASNSLGFTWTVTGGITILSGQGTNSISVSLPVGFGQGTIQVYSSNCYSNSAVRGMTITGNPILGAVTGSNYVCANTSATYTTPVVTGATSYSWSVTGNATLGANSMTSTLATQVINFGAGWTSGVVTVTGSNSCGSSSRTFTVFSTPTQPGSISGLGTGLCGLTNQTYSIAAIPGATSYQWTVPSGVTINSTTGLSINVNFTPAFTSAAGNICVSALNSCGSSPQRCFTVTSRPAIPTITGLDAVCKSNSAIPYSATTSSSVTSWNWTVTGGATIVPSGSTAIVNYTSATSNSATVKANANNVCGSGQPAQKIVAVNLGCRNEIENNSNNQESEFNLFPNPTKGNVNITFDATGNEKYEIKVTDMLGNLISNQILTSVVGFNSYEVNLDKVAKGIYIVSVSNENGNFETKKLVIE